MTDLATGPIAADIRSRLELALQPTVLALVDESALHHGHAGHDGRGESHFRLEIESAAFAGQSRVARQRLVYAALGQLMIDRVHALTIRARAPGEA
ncbi:MAG: BolA family transcriptional regulator [Pseudomonadota bacterium]|nr:BolA family transcriptional regulator [Pseudomonadota bacterium]